MGLIDNVNVQVNGSGDLLSTLQTYTIKVLKPNIVDGKNILTQEMVSAKNTKYVIKYDYDLAENIIIPENCILDVNGGSLNGDFYIDFENCLNKGLYASWFEQTTLLKSIPYMSEKTLYIDKDMVLTSPITNRGSNKYLTSFAIKGLPTSEKKQENRAVIYCVNCSAIDIYGYRNTISGITFFTSHSGSYDNTLPIVKLDTSSETNSDLDSRIYDCGFHLNQNLYNSIITYGRGLSVYNCTFVGGILDASIKCYLKSNNQTDWEQLDEYNGRRFWIHHNTLHGCIKYLIHFATNPSSPSCVFRGIKIENNNADISGAIANIECKNIGTVISNNTFIGFIANDISVIRCLDSENLLISNNILIGIDAQYLKSGQTNDKKIVITSSTNEAIKDVVITNNIIQANQYGVLIPCSVSNIVISDNVFDINSFIQNANNTLLRVWGNTNKCVICNNLFDNSENKRIPEAILGNDDIPTYSIKNVSVKDNKGFINMIYPSASNLTSWVIENVVVKNYNPSDAPAPRYNYVNLSIGFTYFNGEKPLWAKVITSSGEVTWVDATGQTV